MATRIIVKNLPPHLTDDGLKRHFGLGPTTSSAIGQRRPRPTDARLQLSRDGRSRRFGFVGYATATEAERAVEYWHRTFVGSTRITAELARSIEADRQVKVDAEQVAQQAREGKKRKRGQDQPDTKADGTDAKFQEFVKLHESRSKAKTFLNDDDEDNSQQQAVVEPGQGEEDEQEYQVLTVKDEDEHVEESDEDTEAQLRKPRPVAEDAEDDDWLRSRTSRALDLELGDQEDQVTRTSKKIKTMQTPPTDPEEVKAAARTSAIDKIHSTKRLFLRNLSFDVTEPDLASLFSSFGAVADAHMPVAKDTSRPTGTAFVLFERSEDAVAAYEKLDGTDYRGRLMHILPAAPPLSTSTTDDPTGQKKKNVGSKRQEDRRKGAASERYAWNSLYLNQDAVLEQVAQRFNLTKGQLVQPDRSDAAVTMALAEASVLARIRSYFAEHGVDLASFEGKKERDDRILLFKNLPAAADEKKIKEVVEGAGGDVVKCLVPDVGGLALVQVRDGPQGKSVFGKLAYRKFPGAVTLIYLEKGPVDAFKSAAVSPQVTSGQQAAQDTGADSDEITAVFVKNLNFDSRSADLARAMESLPGFRSATVKTKPDSRSSSSSNDRLSMGFGFVEFDTEAEARRAVDVMQGFKLDGHALDLKISTGRTDAARKVAKSNSRKPTPKVVVKNLPFETTRSDVQRLFAAHGKLKACRLPKKVDAHLRGFAFLEFVSRGEAENAVSQLEGTHLLGRRLVLEYANAEADNDVAVDRLVAKTARRSGALKNAEHGKRKVGKVNLDAEADD